MKLKTRSLFIFSLCMLLMAGCADSSSPDTPTDPVNADDASSSEEPGEQDDVSVSEDDTNVPAEEDAGGPTEDVTTPDEEDVTTPEEDVTTPEEDVTTPEEDVTTPEEDVTTPEEDVTTPEEDISGPADECDTIATLQASEEGPVDLTLCDVAVTVVYYNGFYVQELDGDATNIYVGLQTDEEGEWPYAAPSVGDILTIPVTEYGSFNGHQEVLASAEPTVTGTTSLEGYYLDLSEGEGIVPSEELESRLVKASGVSVTSVQGDTLSVSYGAATDVQVYLSGTVQVCEGAKIDIAHAVITEYSGVHQIKVFDAETNVTVVDTTECLAVDYNWDFEDWGESDPPAGFVKTAGFDGFEVIQETDSVHGGASAAKLVVTTEANPELAQVWYMPLDDATEVTFSVWLLDNDPNLKTRLVLKFYDGQQEVGDNAKYSSYSEDSAEWTQLSVTREVPAEATQVRGYIRLYDTGDFETVESASIIIDDWMVDLGDEVEPPVDPPVDPPADGCNTVAELKASEEGPVDLTLCEVAVTTVYYNGYYVQEAGGDAMNIYVGLQLGDDNAWPYDMPQVGDVLSIPVTEYGSFNGHQEVLASSAPTVTGTTTLDAYYTDLSEGILPSEESESALVKLSGATVTDVQGDTLKVSYGTATDVQVYLSGTLQVCEGAVLDIAHGVITEYSGVHQVKVFDAATNVTVVDTANCLAQDYNWDLEDWTESDPPLNFVKTSAADGLSITQETEMVHGGASAAKATVTTDANPELAQTWYMSLDGATSTTFSVWLLDNDPNLRARLVLKFYDGEKEVGDNAKYSSYSEDSAEWTQLSVTREVPAEAIQVRGFLRFYDQADFDTAGTASIIFDDWMIAF